MQNNETTTEKASEKINSQSQTNQLFFGDPKLCKGDNVSSG